MPRESPDFFTFCTLTSARESLVEDKREVSRRGLTDWRRGEGFLKPSEGSSLQVTNVYCPMVTAISDLRLPDIL